MYVARTYRGFGDTANAIKSVQVGGSLATPVAAAAGATSVASILGVSAAIAVPIIGAAIAGITILAVELIKNSGCGQTCIETSQWANQAAALLDQNIATYFAQPVPRTKSQQAAALANYEAIKARLIQMCSDPSTGDAGRRCISDRFEGCAYKQRADSVPPWGKPAAGECWNWDLGYRDPIKNDPNVVADSAVGTDLVGSASSALNAGASSLGVSGGALLLLVAAGVAVWVVAS